MKKVLIVLLLSLSFRSGVMSCTTFFINKNGQLAFGRNYDWITNTGYVCKNARGMNKTSFAYPEGSTINWVSKYGSLTFNQYGKEFPTGGMNEKGLVVELMWLEGSEYPGRDTRPVVDVLQWIQYQLDNCATIEEVIATDKRIRIGSTDNPPLHYLVADAKGKAATIEFLQGKMVVHKGNDLPFPVLTNTEYSIASNVVKGGGSSSGGNRGAGYNDNSIQRFAKACSMLQDYKLDDANQSIIDFSFDVLGKVSQPGSTKWSIVYDITNKTIYFKTDKYPAVKSIAFADFDFNCSPTGLAFNMNQLADGKVSSQFIPFTKEMNKKLVDQSAEESKSQVSISEANRERTVAYAFALPCK